MQKGYRHRYSLWEVLIVFSQSMRAFPIMAASRLKHRIDPHFQERLMLAVTEVNGCEVCSYAHTQVALKQGMDSAEIASFLQGDGEMIKETEAKAIIFAQHYADSNGRPEHYAYDVLLEEYGKKKTKAILATIQIMMMGNVFGLPMSAFFSRLKKQPYHNSNIFYELVLLIAPMYLFPFALLTALCLWPIVPGNIIFAKESGGV
ncbi:MAG TPA: carboxymuconolactone decarboxylase family protein [Bacillota bacterium]|nr:carboxymuconolactone decarboxylase family protein [Bacillota bacterium]HPF42602.1 carboxymuconolactone decarboxylase family protein [Bacillota bacterium]HPJ86069.1 carboxymuconolactone decarboxylase family protein [Bacillota bacterium]HPQ62122.1 carboxymuconolactone decarboxylase family protein [Bacillota bacterium]HRX91500.1 carboxymuconolactone decarboxylase family protein [Candidatus Izemoplasmatales bacterium]